MTYSDANAILQVASAYASQEGDHPDVAAALDRVVVCEGDLTQALADLAGTPEQFGPVTDFLERLVDQTFAALLGKEELVEQLETHRKSVVGKAVTGIGVGAGIISGVTGLQVVFATIVFLYLVPIGVRAAYDTWLARKEAGADGV